jgi:SAM-dependent methyltransferase
MEQPELIPPKELVDCIGGGDFKVIGQHFFRHFTQLCDLKSDEQVLDVGCGAGRMAVPLTSYLSEAGSYEGFDIVPASIEWCTAQISSRYPNFRFQLADVHSTKYNPTGLTQGAEYTFPYEDDQFDFVFATSVFTHMWPDETRRYLQEIARVTRPGGRVLVTFFLLNDEGLALINEGKAQVTFHEDFGTHWATSKELPDDEVALRVAFKENVAWEMVEDAGLRIRTPIHYGRWPGREQFVSFQDLIVADLPENGQP